MRRKLFNIWRGEGKGQSQLQYLRRGIAKMYIHECMHTDMNVHMKTHVHASNIYIYICMHAYANTPKHLYIYINQ